MSNYDYWIEGGGDPLNESQSDWMYDKFTTDNDSFLSKAFDINPLLKSKFYDYDYKSPEEKKYDQALIDTSSDLLEENYKADNEYIRKSVISNYKNCADENEIESLISIYANAQDQFNKYLEKETFLSIENFQETFGFDILPKETDYIKNWDNDPSSVEKGNFLLKDGDYYVAIDNTTDDCWTEEFKTLKGAVIYLTQPVSPEEIRDLEQNESTYGIYDKNNIVDIYNSNTYDDALIHKKVYAELHNETEDKYELKKCHIDDLISNKTLLANLNILNECLDDLNAKNSKNITSNNNYECRLITHELVQNKLTRAFNYKKIENPVSEKLIVIDLNSKSKKENTIVYKAYEEGKIDPVTVSEEYIQKYTRLPNKEDLTFHNNLLYAKIGELTKTLKNSSESELNITNFNLCSEISNDNFIYKTVLGENTKVKEPEKIWQSVLSESIPTANKHGGKREGAGRPSTGKNVTTVSITIPNVDYQYLKSKAEESNTTIGKLIVNDEKKIIALEKQVGFLKDANKLFTESVINCLNNDKKYTAAIIEHSITNNLTQEEIKSVIDSAIKNADSIRSSKEDSKTRENQNINNHGRRR